MASMLSQTNGSRAIVVRLPLKWTFRFRRVGRVECGLDLGSTWGDVSLDLKLVPFPIPFGYPFD